MPAAPGERRTYYSRSRVRILVLVGVILVVLVGLAIPPAFAKAHNTLNATVGSALFLAALVAVARLMRCKLVADDDGVTVRNPLRTYRIAWANITGIGQGRFSYGANGAANTGSIMEIERTSGRRIRVHAIASFRSRPTSYSDGVVNELLTRLQGVVRGKHAS